MQKSERIVRYTGEETDEKIRNGEDRMNAVLRQYMDRKTSTQSSG